MELLTRAEAAERSGINPDTFSSYVARGQAPEPAQRVGRTPLWAAADIDTWLARRPGQGSRTSERARRRAATRRPVSQEMCHGGTSGEGHINGPNREGRSHE